MDVPVNLRLDLHLCSQTILQYGTSVLYWLFVRKVGPLLLPYIYSPLVWVLTVGRASALRRATLAAAAVASGDDVLDVGCATGTLTLAARDHAGETARVAGLDASEPMLSRARRRAVRAGRDIEFVSGRAERLPFDDGSFDAVVLSLVLHYLSEPDALRALAEARRVLRDGGRVVVVDFTRSVGILGRVRAHLMLHGGTAATAPDLGALLNAGGLTQTRSTPSPVGALAIASGLHHDT